jgi:hypothetical protein
MKAMECNELRSEARPVTLIWATGFRMGLGKRAASGIASIPHPYASSIKTLLRAKVTVSI